MNSAFLLFCADAKLSKLENVLMVEFALAAACAIAGWQGLFVLTGCVGFLIRGEAQDQASEVKSEIYKQNGIRYIEKVLSKILAQFSVCQAALLIVSVNRFNRDSAQRQRQSLGIPHHALTARLYLAPIASFA